MISADLISILVCPKCKKNLLPDEEEKGLVCSSCALVYEVRDGIPIMLVDEARPLAVNACHKEPGDE